MYIFKITNTTNGMSYIMSTCLNKCYLENFESSDSLMGKAIKTKGINNFTSCLLKEVDDAEACTWADYYIIIYNTMYPNGYNEHWNCSDDLRQEILFKTHHPSDMVVINYQPPLTTVENLLLQLANRVEKELGQHADCRICTPQ